MGDRSLRRDDGGGNGGWWLAHHSHARPSGGEVAAGPWLCGRNHCRANHSSGELLRDRKSTRLNSSHLVISYAVFCLKKKKINLNRTRRCVHHLGYLVDVLIVIRMLDEQCDSARTS